MESMESEIERINFIGAIDIIKCQLNISSMWKNQFTSGQPSHTCVVKCTVKMPSIKTLRWFLFIRELRRYVAAEFNDNEQRAVGFIVEVKILLQ